MALAAAASAQLLPLLLLLLGSAYVSAQATATWPMVVRHAFTPAECDSIASTFVQQLRPELDERQEQGVSRLNRWDEGQKLMRSGAFDWIYARVLKLIGALGDGAGDGAGARDETAEAAAFRERVEFNLMHEFTGGKYFDWHVDTKPGDGTRRTFNVNVMLSRPDVDFGGGALQVGKTEIVSWQGDLYVYPASFPHAVHDVSWGTRRTLVVAMADGDSEGGGRAGEGAYWRAAQANFERLLRDSAGLGKVSKLHLLHGQFLEALGDSAGAAAAFCQSYRVTSEAAQYVAHFMSDGLAALQAGPSPELALAHSYFAMAACIDPQHSEATEALSVVQQALGQVS